MKFTEDAVLQAAATIVAGVIGRVEGPLDAAHSGKLLQATYEMIRATERVIEDEIAADRISAQKDLAEKIRRANI